MDRLEGNGIVERERVENIRRDGQRGRGGQGVRGAQGVRGGRRGRRIRYTRVSNEIRATLIDHVINHGLSQREAGQRVQPNINRSTVASIIRTFQRENRIEVREHSGGRTRLLSIEQEHAIVDMVVQNNTLRLKEIQQRITQDNQLFHNIHQCCLSTIDRVLRRNAIRMKQVYKVPFERNSVRVKELRFQFVQRILAMDGAAQPHEFIFIDEAGFDLSKTRRRGHNVTGQRAIVHVPGQRRGNITLCAAVSLQGLLHHHAKLGPYNSQHILTFLDALHNIVVQTRSAQVCSGMG
ncbi:hypothetical protein PO909_007692 [Leuciscus waleckii]